MRILKKHIEIGEKSFDVSVDRDIVAEVLEAFPEQFEFLKELGDKNGIGKSDTIGLAKAHKLKDWLSFKDKIKDVSCFALPFMLKKAGETSLTSDEIISYVEENEVDEFYSVIWEIVLMGFTIGGEERKAKVKLTVR